MVLVGETEIARGEVSIDAGRSVSVRLATVLGALPSPGEQVVLRTFEAVRGRREYLANVQTADCRTLALTDVELISAFQQRAIVRVGTDILVTLAYEMVGEELTDAAVPIQAKILDLSATGLRLHCAVPLEKGYRFGFHLSTDLDDLTLVAVALRREDVPLGYRYGCRFVGTTQREANALHRFVLSEQIARRGDIDEN